MIDKSKIDAYQESVKAAKAAKSEEIAAKKLAYAKDYHKNNYVKGQDHSGEMPKKPDTWLARIIAGKKGGGV